MIKSPLMVYIFMMAEGAASWESVKQTLTTSSIMEAEYVACYEATCHAIYMLAELHFSFRGCSLPF